MKRFFTVAGVILALFVALFVAGLWYIDPTGLFRPTDQALISYFNENRETFYGLRDLALADEGKVGAVSEAYMADTGLSASRQKAYERFLNRLNRCAQVGIDEFQIRFICSSGGTGPIGWEWNKGIIYLPMGASRVGTVTSDLDTVTKEGETFLRPLGAGWYLFYEKTN